MTNIVNYIDEAFMKLYSVNKFVNTEDLNTMMYKIEDAGKITSFMVFLTKNLKAEYSILYEVDGKTHLYHIIVKNIIRKNKLKDILF